LLPAEVKGYLALSLALTFLLLKERKPTVWSVWRGKKAFILSHNRTPHNQGEKNENGVAIPETKETA
jgi:hypothetical protein